MTVTEARGRTTPAGTVLERGTGATCEASKHERHRHMWHMDLRTPARTSTE
jgi:hypothetical protein